MPISQQTKDWKTRSTFEVKITYDAKLFLRERWVDKQLRTVPINKILNLSQKASDR